ncbi:hypothetical protein AB0B28_06415 [Glycomyces sp. NPDC046736]|uniref:hypothetical protein n=1 Tax=Glycomyces sp. NPDC046736 TaxID=3155615 RepID=UPI003411BD83
MQVAYRQFDDPAPDHTGGAYAYCWPLELGTPLIGARIWVPVEDLGLVPGVVVGFGRDGYKGPLKVVNRLATPEEIAAPRD